MVEQTEHVENIPKSEQPFAKCAFGDERRRLARMFTNYFNRTKSDSGYVANLNGEWGTGKTFFVTEWSRLLKVERYGVVFIDAWNSDYLDDPLSIVASEILQQLTEQLKNEFGLHDCEKLKKGFWKKSAGLTKAFLPAVAQAASKNFFGDDTVELIKDLLAGAIDYSEQEMPKSLSDKLGEFGEHAFATHQRHREFANDFKLELQKLIDLTTSKSGTNKVYIFIDELDRCRPTYAIEMLETIKHLFDIKNLVFIISTDTAQLEHSIKAVYGNGFDSFEYLHRFFKQRITLPKPDYYKFLCMEKAFESIDFSSHHFYPKIDSADKLRALVALQAETNGVELRKLEYIYSQIDLFLLSVNSKHRKAINMFYLVAAIFTINIVTEPDTDILKSIRTSNGKANDNTIINPIYISEVEPHQQTMKFNEFSMMIIDEYHNLPYRKNSGYQRTQWNIRSLKEGLPTVLLGGLEFRASFDYVSMLISGLNDESIILITNEELLERVKTFNINDLLSQ